MQFNKTLYFTLFIVLLLFISCSRVDNSITQPNPVDRIQSALNQFSINNDQVSGNIALVDLPDRDLWIGTYGYFDNTNSQPIRGEDQFLIASMTKTFIATIIMQLYEENLIHMDSLIYDYLPQKIRNMLLSVYDSTITVKHVLSHRSGFKDYSGPELIEEVLKDPSKQWSYEELVGFAVNKAFQLQEPGIYNYSNSNYLILGIVAEHLCQDSLYLILKNRIFLPLNLNDTYLAAFEPRDKEIAHGYEGENDASTHNLSYAWAGGGIVSTVRDLRVFLRSLVNSELFLSFATFNMMINVEDNSYYGLGITVYNHPNFGIFYGHGGAIDGYRSYMYYFSDFDAILCGGITALFSPREIESKINLCLSLLDAAISE